MIIRSQNIECDVFTQTAKPVHFVQGEKGREIMFTFVNSAIPIEDEPQPVPLSGLTATIHILKPDGNFIIDRMTISGNAAIYVLGENACAAGGAGVYDVSLSKGSDVVYTAHGAFVGDFRAVSDDVVNSVSEAYGTIFPEGFQEKLVAGEHITIDGNVISSEGERYTAGDNVHISEQNVISATDTRYTAGDNVQISEQNVISATDTRYTAGDGVDISDGNVISVESHYSMTLLLDRSSSPDLSPITLSDSWRNYDALFVVALFNSEALTGGLVFKELLEDAVNNTLYACNVSYATTYTGFVKPINNDGVSLTPYGGNLNGIYKIYGVTF